MGRNLTLHRGLLLGLMVRYKTISEQDLPQGFSADGIKGCLEVGETGSGDLCPSMRRRMKVWYLLVLITALVMPDLAGLDDVTNGTSPCVTICCSGSGELHPVSSPAPETEYRRSKNHFHVLTD
ncbi:unnamed protein product [Dibothriocephalus latus]|uniref:Uncharacterized protein n=1 Tax=Dibothriocephalus latus TaxID=60516 RepID=A0A3P7LSU4_DIBLA|nr:unnamed protein product [Dibothriocephalus latus]